MAASGVYQFQGNTATVSSKLILAGDCTMGSTVIFGGGANGMRNSAGSCNAAATTATLSGAVTVSDVDGGNRFSQNSGATLRLTGLLSGANALRVNDSYTSSDVTNTLQTPGGTVALMRVAGSTTVGGVTVVNGTLLVANASGNAGTGVTTSRALTGVDTAVAASPAIGQSISGTNIAPGAVITGITLGNGAANSTVVMSAVPTGAGTLDLTGPQNYATLTATAGFTNVNGSLAGGTATVNANATAYLTASQTLAALTIGTVMPAEPGLAESRASLFTGLGLLLGLRRRRS